MSSLANNYLNREYIRQATRAVRYLAAKYPEFTTDEVHARMTLYPEDARILGVAMVAARRAGIITSTGAFVPSRRPECHQRPVRIWRSNSSAFAAQAA